MESSTAQFLWRQFACVQLPNKEQARLLPEMFAKAASFGASQNASLPFPSWGELRPSVTQVGAGW